MKVVTALLYMVGTVLVIFVQFKICSDCRLFCLCMGFKMSPGNLFLDGDHQLPASLQHLRAEGGLRLLPASLQVSSSYLILTTKTRKMCETGEAE
jgi:hypothetical protein